MTEPTVPTLRNDEDTLRERMTDNAYEQILPARYLDRNEDGEIIEQQEELFERVAKNIAVAEAVHVEPRLDWVPETCTHDHFGREKYGEYINTEGLPLNEETARYFSYDRLVSYLDHDNLIRQQLIEKKEKFQDMMEHLKLMPNTPCLINAGRELQQLSACFVLDIDDDMRDIHEVAADAAEIFQAGGGLGYPFSFIRPYGDKVGSTGGVASGPISFMNTLDQVCSTVAQGGCVVEDTRVMTEEGYKKISDIHNDIPLRANGAPSDVTVQTRSGDYHQVKETSDSGTMEVFKVETGSGYTVRGSFDHPILTIRDGELEYIEIGDIDEDDVVVMDQSASLPEAYAVLDGISDNRHFNENDISTPDVLNGDVAFFLGVLWGDGTFDRGEEERIVFSIGKTERERPIKERLESVLSEWDVNYSVIDQNKKERYGDYWRIEINSKGLTDWLKKNNLDKRLDTVPEKLYHSPASIPDFLAGMVCDATYASDGGVVRYTTISEKLAENLQDLLMLCGVPSKIYSDEERQGAYGDNEIFMVETRAGPSTETFNEVIPHPFKGELAKGGERQNQVPDVEKITGRVLSDNFTKNNKLPPEADRKSMKELRRYERGERTPSRERLVSTLQDVGVDIPEELSESHWFESVKAVESVGHEHVYDIEILYDAHEFVGDNFCVHNVRRGAQMGVMDISHPDIPYFIHAKNTDVSLAHTLLLDDPDDPTHNSFGEALEEARDLIDGEGRVPEHLRNAAEGHLSNFNISVGVTEEFMDAVKNGHSFTFTNPRTQEAHIATEETKELYSWFDMEEYVDVGEVLSVPAQEIWERIVDGAHSNGEPGVIYLDRVNEENTFDPEEHPEYEINATNPSLRAGTKVMTQDGIVPIEELENERFKTPNRRGEWQEAECWLSGENEKLYRIELDTGAEYYATEEHKWPVAQLEKRFVSDSERQYERTKTVDVEEGDYLPIAENSAISFGDFGTKDEGFLVGWLYGDGSITDRKDGRRQYGFTISQEDAECGILERILDILEEKTGVSYSPTERVREGEPWYEIHSSNSEIREFMKEVGVESKEEGIPDILWEGASEEFREGFIDGLFSADGCVRESRIVLTTTREKISEDIRDIFGFYGIKTTTTNSEFENEWGEFERFDIAASARNVIKFREKFNLSHEYKQEKLWDIVSKEEQKINSSHARVVEVEETSMREKVWDISVKDETNTFKLSTCATGNCGEEPLFDGDACNLTHINLSTIVEEDSETWDSYTDRMEGNWKGLEAEVDWFLENNIDYDELNDRVDTGVNFLDNVVTMSDFPVENIDDTVRENRKIGLGIMGLAQLFIQLGVEYGSEESQEIARQLMKHIHHRSKYKSQKLAEERGTFENWEKSKWSEPKKYDEFFRKHVGVDPIPEGYPQRNHETTTIAPTGTTSQIANTSGGCEPIFNVCYFKNVTEDIQGDDMLVEFDSLFLKTLEENDIDVEQVKEEAVELMNNNEFDGAASIPSVPDEIGNLFVTTNDLSAKEHASVQCALQEGVGSGISKTVNAPNDATLEDAKEAFEYIHDNGGKSVTYYRDGSRTKQVQTTRRDNQDIEDEEEAKTMCQDCGTVGGCTCSSTPLSRDAPKVASGTRYEIQTGYGDMFVNIVEDEHGPVELIANVGKSGGTVQSMTEAIGRLVSKSLQNGVPPEEIIKQLDNIHSPKKTWDEGDGIESVPDGIAVALERYMERSEEETLNHSTTEMEESEEPQGNSVNASECLECGAQAVVYEEGCDTCKPELGGCGASKCG